MNNQPPTKEDAILIGVRTADVPAWETEESLAELAELTRTAGGRVLKSIIQARAAPDSAIILTAELDRPLAAKLKKYIQD